MKRETEAHTLRGSLRAASRLSKYFSERSWRMDKAVLETRCPDLHSLLEPARDVREGHHVLGVGITLGVC
jgi:hypothetical protein